MEASPSGLPMDEATAAPSLSTEAGTEDGYFSLLDMFVWTRWVDTGHLLLSTLDLSLCSDVAVSVAESAEQARTFLTLLLAEIHLQLTTISWLSVNSQVDSSASKSCIRIASEGS